MSKKSMEQMKNGGGGVWLRQLVIILVLLGLGFLAVGGKLPEQSKYIFNFVFYVFASVMIVYGLEHMLYVRKATKEQLELNPIKALAGHRSVFTSRVIYWIATLVLLFFTSRIPDDKWNLVLICQLVMLAIAIGTQVLLFWLDKRFQAFRKEEDHESVDSSARDK